MQMRTSVTDLVVVVIYLLAVTAIGCLIPRRPKSTDQFAAAGGRLPGWVVGLSIIGTFVSSLSFIGSPGKTFGGTWVPFVFSLTLPYAAWVSTKWFVPFFRNCGSLSAYHHLEERFGAWSRLYASLCNVLYHIARIGAILFAVSVAVAHLFCEDPEDIQIVVQTLILIIGVLVIIYAVIGGIEAVIWTDVIQSIILVGGTLVCLAIVLGKIPHGFAGVISEATGTKPNKLALGSMAFDLSAPESFWTMILFGFFINLQNFGGDQTFVQRYFTAKSEAAASRSVWMGALLFIPISALLFFIGTSLFVYYKSAGILPEGIENDHVLPHFIATELPTGVAGLLIAAILAAAMSTVDSSLNSSSTLLLVDVRNRFFNRAVTQPDGTELRDESKDLFFLKLSTVLIGILGIGLGLILSTQPSGILDGWWTLSGILSGGTLGLILLARFTRVQGWQAGAAGIAAGFLGMAVVVIAGLDSDLALVQTLKPVSTVLHKRMAIVVGTLLIFGVGALAGRTKTPR